MSKEMNSNMKNKRCENYREFFSKIAMPSLKKETKEK